MASSSSWLERAASNSRAQFAATAVASGAVVATAILGFQTVQRRKELQELKDSLSLSSLPTTTTASGKNKPLTKAEKEDLRAEQLARRAQAGDYDDELILEQLARNRVFLGPEGLDKLRNAFVIVVGCGGVGSHCTAALARSGVSRIRLIDFDQVTLSSLNRHAVATLADVGTPKVGCLSRRLGAIAPWVQFDQRLEKYCEEAADSLLEAWDQGNEGDSRKPDFVVDAIDNIDTKVSLLKYCHDRSIPVISAMGAGCKSDPTRIMVGDIGTSTDDRLSRATRRRLKLLGITKGIPTVFSTEKSGDGKAELLPLPDDEVHKGNPGDLGVLPDFRVRILPVLGTMPAVFGYTVANHVILSITGYPLDYVQAKGREKMYDGLLAAVQGGEEKILRHLSSSSSGGSKDPSVTIGLKIPITTSDTAFLVDEVYKSRSAITGLTTRLTLTRWRKPEGSEKSILVAVDYDSDSDSEEVKTTQKKEKKQKQQKSTNLRLGELVCMTKEEAARHDKLVLRGDKSVEEVYDEETVRRVEGLMRDAEGWERYR